MEQYRKLSAKEVQDLFDTHFDDSTLQKKARKMVAASYPKSAHKVIVKANCEYNDNWYDITPTVIVLDKNFNELTPNKSFDSYEIFSSETINGSSSEVEEMVEDFSFFMNSEEAKIPDLYVKI